VDVRIRKLLLGFVLLVLATWAMMGRSSHEPLSAAGASGPEAVETAPGGYSVRRDVAARPGTPIRLDSERLGH
jgi:hypothetical protein